MSEEPATAVVSLPEPRRGRGLSEGARRRLRIVEGCIVCKTCEFHAPDVFVVREKGLVAEVLVDQPDADRLPDVIEAIRQCPEHVIKYTRSREPPDE